MDTNVLSALLAGQDGSAKALELLFEARRLGSAMICGVVYAELLANPFLQETDAIGFLRETDIRLEFDLHESVWRETGRRYASYAKRRDRSAGGAPRRLLADFIIGSHALLQADRLLTFDATHYKSNFPELELVGG